MLTRRLRDDRGFTLVELLVAVVILGIVAAPLAGVVLGYLKNSSSVAGRMAESHDAQMAASYWSQDVQAIGVRNYTVTGTGYFPLKQSVETGVGPAAGLYPCGAATLPPAVVRLAWDDFTTVAATPSSQTRVAYVVQGTELHRVVCSGSATPVSDVTVAHDLVTPHATVACAAASGAAIPCTGSGTAVPSTVALTLTLHDPDSPSGTTYTVTLTGQRRQS